MADDTQEFFNTSTSVFILLLYYFICPKLDKFTGQENLKKELHFKNLFKKEAMRWLLLFIFFSKEFVPFECKVEPEIKQKSLRNSDSAIIWLLTRQMSSLNTKFYKLWEKVDENHKHVMKLSHENLLNSFNLSDWKKRVETNLEKKLGKEIRTYKKSVHDILLKLDNAKGGTAYTHWGKTKCTSHNAETIYSGFTGGSYYYGGNAAPNKLCLPNKPQWGLYDNKINKSPYIGATIMYNYDINIKRTLFDNSYTGYRLECAACLSTGSTTVMIPGRKTCYDGWTKEYTGYLMAGYPGHSSASEYLCLDKNPDFLKKSSSWSYVSLLLSVHSKCNSATPCPPYVDGRELVCVVCSR